MQMYWVFYHIIKPMKITLAPEILFENTIQTEIVQSSKSEDLKI